MNRLIALVLLLMVPQFAFASETNGIESILETKEEQQISNAGTNNSEDIRMCVEAYCKKNNGTEVVITDDSLDYIHAAENIKIYAFTTKKPSDFYNEYRLSGNLTDFVSSNYSIIRVFRDNNNDLIDSVFYMKPENAEQSDADWKRVSSGGMIFSDETIEFLTDKSELLNVLESCNIENPQNLKVITRIEGLEGVIYFENNGIQIVMPLSDGYKYDSDVVTCKKMTPYVVSEFFEARREADLAKERKLEEWDNLPMNQKTYGSSNEINYINLKPAIFTDNIEVSKEKLQNTKDVNTISRFIGVFVLGAILAVGAIVCYRRSCKGE